MESKAGEMQGAAALSSSHHGSSQPLSALLFWAFFLSLAAPSVSSLFLLPLHSALHWPIMAFSNLMTLALPAYSPGSDFL